MATLVLDYDSDESLSFYYRDAFLGNVNHDEDGWAGMTKARDLMVRFAEEEGCGIEIKGDPNV